MPGRQVYSVGGQGQSSITDPCIVSTRNPINSDPGNHIAGDITNPNGYPYVVGQLWQNSGSQNFYVYLGGGQWQLQEATTGDIVTLSDTADTTVDPDGSGNIKLSGTANQINVVAGTNELTFSIPATFIAPGSIASTTTITSGTSMVATTTMTAGTGITSTTGNIVATAGAVNAGTSMSATTTVTAGTGLTVTTGDATITAGNVLINGAGKYLQVQGGLATDFVGQATLTNGTVTVANTNITAADRIFVTRSAVNASSALGVFKVVITASTNFVITACDPTDGSTETGDASTVDYFIVRQV